MESNSNGMLHLTIAVPPSVNHYLAYRTVTKNGKVMAMSYKTQEAKIYQKKLIEYLKEQVELQNWVKSDNIYQHYYLDADFYFPRIDMDANNYWKVPADAMTESECIWIDDTQLCERVNKVCYDTKNPRIEMVLYPVDYIGIFENSKELEKFQNKCETCSRGKGNCSVRTKAKQGRVQEEVVNCNCTKFKLKKEKEK